MGTWLRTAVYEFPQTPDSLVQIGLRAGQADPDGVARHLSVTAVPLEGPGGTHLGALAIFWALPRR